VPYYARVFCTAEAVPTIRTVLEFLRQNGVPADAPGESARALASPKWKSFELLYDPAKESILVECHRGTSPGSRCRQTVREELNGLEDLADTPAKRRVAECLNGARFIVSCEVLGDHHHQELARFGPFLDYFVDHCGGLIDVEDEGFYARTGRRLLVGGRAYD
jgi:hypothetical protein